MQKKLRTIVVDGQRFRWVLPGNIFGSVDSPIGTQFTYAQTGLTAPTITPVRAADNSLQALEVTANPGPSTDPDNSVVGFGVGFGYPGCVDASAFSGVRFKVAGDLGTCGLRFSLAASADNDVANGAYGRCTTGDCFPPQSERLSTGTGVVRFARMGGGRPIRTLDPHALNAAFWALSVPTDGVTPACTANLTISEVTFVSGSDARQIDYPFDGGAQGWSLSTAKDGPGTNLAVTPPPPGGALPALGFAAADGDPGTGPGSLRLTVRFTGLDQFVSPVIDFYPPGLDLAGHVVSARVRLVSGSLPEGGVVLHARTGPSGTYVAGTFLQPGDLPAGTWVPLDLLLTPLPDRSFDPTNVVQIGLRFQSGSSAGGDVFVDRGDLVFEIDAVTD